MDALSHFRYEQDARTSGGDDGPENNGEVNTFTQELQTIQKVVANYNTKKSNNVIEAWNKKFKHSILKKFKPKSFEHLQVLIPEIPDYANNLKLPRLKTLSPNEVLAGMSYSDLDLENKISIARQNRKQVNQNMTTMSIRSSLRKIKIKNNLFFQ